MEKASLLSRRTHFLMKSFRYSTRRARSPPLRFFFTVPLFSDANSLHRVSKLRSLGCTAPRGGGGPPPLATLDDRARSIAGVASAAASDPRDAARGFLGVQRAGRETGPRSSFRAGERRRGTDSYENCACVVGFDEGGTPRAIKTERAEHAVPPCGQPAAGGRHELQTCTNPNNPPGCCCIYTHT